MNAFEQKGKNFLIMILFLVFTVSGAKTLHDITVADTEQPNTELLTEKDVAIKH